MTKETKQTEEPQAEITAEANTRIFIGAQHELGNDLHEILGNILPGHETTYVVRICTNIERMITATVRHHQLQNTNLKDFEAHIMKNVEAMVETMIEDEVDSALLEQKQNQKGKADGKN